MPTAGDGFRITRSDSSERRGCVAKDDAVLGPFRNALVVYVVGHGVNDIAAALTSAVDHQSIALGGGPILI